VGIGGIKLPSRPAAPDHSAPSRCQLVVRQLGQADEPRAYQEAQLSSAPSTIQKTRLLVSAYAARIPRAAGQDAV
jgi:hypothetical protein